MALLFPPPPSDYGHQGTSVSGRRLHCVDVWMLEIRDKGNLAEEDQPRIKFDCFRTLLSVSLGQGFI